MKNRKALLAGMTLLAVAVGGCTSGGAARVEPASVMRYYSPSDITGACPVEVAQPPAPGLLRGDDARPRPGAINLNCFKFPGAEGLAYPAAVTSDAARNRLAMALIAQADTVCTVEKSLMLERQSEVNGWLSILTTGLSTSAAIVNGELASNILAGGAAFTSGSRDHINTHVYRNQIIQTITTAIDTERASALIDIRTNLGRSNAAYSIDEAIRDINAYHQICSFGYGLQVVMEAVEAQAEYERALSVSSIDDELVRLQRDRVAATGKDAEAITEQMRVLRAERSRRATGFDPNPPETEGDPEGADTGDDTGGDDAGGDDAGGDDAGGDDAAPDAPDGGA